MWLDESHVFSGTWEVTSEEKTQEADEGKSAEGEEEEKSEAPVMVMKADVAAAFAEGDVDGRARLDLRRSRPLKRSSSCR